MTEHDWDSFVQLYRELWKAYADMATMRTMLTTSEFVAEQNNPEIAMKAVRGWMARLEKSRGANFYAKYLAKGEAHIAQAEPERSGKLLIQLLSQDGPRIPRPNSSSSGRQSLRPSWRNIPITLIDL